MIIKTMIIKVIIIHYKMIIISKYNKIFNIIKVQNICVYYIMYFIYIELLNDKLFNCNKLFN